MKHDIYASKCQSFDRHFAALCPVLASGRWLFTLLVVSGLQLLIWGMSAFGGDFSDTFDDGVLNPALWESGGSRRGVGGYGSGNWQYSCEEISAPDGFARLRVFGPTSANTYGADSWLTTTCDYNDGKNHVINFRWGVSLNDNHINAFAVQITDGTVPVNSSINWFFSDTAATKSLILTASHLGLPESGCTSSAGLMTTDSETWSIFIDGSTKTATLYTGANLTGTALCQKQLDVGYSWLVRFVIMDGTSVGFPAGDNSFRLYEYNSSASTTEAGLLAYYPFNGNARDESGNGNNAVTITATPATDRTGTQNSAYAFDGSQFIAVPSSASLQITGSALTLTAWVHPTAYSSGKSDIVRKLEHAPSIGGYAFGIQPDGLMHFQAVYSSGMQGLTASAGPVPLNTWSHVAVTYNGSRVRYYLNGVQVSEIARSGQLVGSSAPLAIGKITPSFPGEFFYGRIDEVRIYNRVLSAAEVEGLAVASKIPVILIPGAGGTYLRDASDPHWVTGWPQDVLITGVGDVHNLQCESNGVPISGVSARLAAAGVLTTVAEKHVYYLDELKAFLLANGYTEGKTLFEYPYDFRKSIANAAGGLAEFITNHVAKAAGNPVVDLVGHSMGGLVAKQFTADYPGSVGTMITVATPHLGSPTAYKALRYGDDLTDKSFGKLFISACKVKRAAHNWPGLYSLLPDRSYFTEGAYFYETAFGGVYLEDYVDTDGDGHLGILDYDATLSVLRNGSERFLAMRSLHTPYCMLEEGLDPQPIDTLSKDLVNRHCVDFHGDADEWRRPAGVKAYAIAGYNQGTLCRITEQFVDYVVTPGSWRTVTLREFCYTPAYTMDGDGNVPVWSAAALDADAVYYLDLASNYNHTTLLKCADLQKEVLQLLGGNGDVVSGSKITRTYERRVTRTILFGAHSPVVFSVFDSVGNETGFLADGDMLANIPGSDLDWVGGDLYVTVPEGDVYTVIVHGTDSGSLSFEQREYDLLGNTLRRLLWEPVPVRSGSVDLLVTHYGAIDPVLSVDIDGDGTPERNMLPDADRDGVPDTIDQCQGTALLEPVDAHGCSIDQLVPCEGPVSGGSWKNHGEYVSTVARVAEEFVVNGWITGDTKDAIVARAANSQCGR